MSNDYPGKTVKYKLLNNTGELPVIKILAEIVIYLNSKESSYWSFWYLAETLHARSKSKGFEYKISK
ncbi:13494_t:CDS:2, partial [Funneliformis geosporum]